MKQSHIAFLAAVGAVAASVSVAAGTEAAALQSPAERQRIAALTQRVAELEHRQATQQLAAGVAGVLEAQVLQDAADRSRLIAVGGFTAGYDGKFALQSEDGSFRIEPGFHFQFRSIANFRDDVDGDDWNATHGFELRRAKPDIGGNVFTEDFTYYFLFDVSRNDGSTKIEQAWVQYAFENDWAVRLGQFATPVFKEQLHSAKRQLAVERSFLNTVVTGAGQAVSQGVEAIYKGEQLGLAFAFHDGFNSLNTAALVDEPDFGVSARAEYFFAGDRKQYATFTADGNEQDLLVAGVAGDFTQSGSEDVYRYTADLQWENTAGTGAFAAFYARTTEDDDTSTTDYGLLLQANQMVADDIEVFAQYGLILLDEEAVVLGQAEDTYNLLVIGVNHYYKGHAAKVTIDAVYLPDGSPQNDTTGGILASPDTQFIIRGQFQLLL
ncbi:MAG: porin [Phycisphaerae bacterium]